MDDWSPVDFVREYGPPARFCEYEPGSMLQFLADDEDVLTGMVLYASDADARWRCVPPQVILIVVTYVGDEWWISPANVVIPQC
jgi:hypothetical protein